MAGSRSNCWAMDDLEAEPRALAGCLVAVGSQIRRETPIVREDCEENKCGSQTGLTLYLGPLKDRSRDHGPTMIPLATVSSSENVNTIPNSKTVVKIMWGVG